MIDPLLRPSSLVIRLTFILSIAVAALTGCHSDKGGMPPQPAPTLQVFALDTATITTYQEFTSTLEGKTNVEIRPQVEGYLEKIFVDEGAFVKEGQPLFQISPRVYQEQANNAGAALQAAEANLAKAQVEVDRLTPLVQGGVISDVQLKTAQSAYAAAKAQVAQAKAQTGSAGANLGFTLIKAPVSGYIGRIPYKVGSLVGRAEPSPLTVVSDIDQVYAYFAMSEVDFNQFKQHYAGATLQDKIKALPAVTLLLAGGVEHPEKGKVELVEGQFDKTTGAITFRASFPNKGGLIRSGNTGKIRLPEEAKAALVIPQKSTYELQDKLLIYTLGDSSKVKSQAITIAGKTNNYYIIKDGAKVGDKVVYNGLDKLHDGEVISPVPFSKDSLRIVNPL